MDKVELLTIIGLTILFTALVFIVWIQKRFSKLIKLSSIVSLLLVFITSIYFSFFYNSFDINREIDAQLLTEATASADEAYIVTKSETENKADTPLSDSNKVEPVKINNGENDNLIIKNEQKSQRKANKEEEVNKDEEYNYSVTTDMESNIYIDEKFYKKLDSGEQLTINLNKGLHRIMACSYLNLGINQTITINSNSYSSNETISFELLKIAVEKEFDYYFNIIAHEYAACTYKPISFGSTYSRINTICIKIDDVEVKKFYWDGVSYKSFDFNLKLRYGKHKIFLYGLDKFDAPCKDSKFNPDYSINVTGVGNFTIEIKY